MNRNNWWASCQLCTAKCKRISTEMFYGRCRATYRQVGDDRLELRWCYRGSLRHLGDCEIEGLILGIDLAERVPNVFRHQAVSRQPTRRNKRRRPLRRSGRCGAEPARQDLFLQLAQAESSPARLRRDKLAAAGIHDEHFVPGFRTRLLAKLAQRFGPRFVLPTVAAAEFADHNKYASQGDAQSISAEERGHAAAASACKRASANSADAKYP